MPDRGPLDGTALVAALDAAMPSPFLAASAEARSRGIAAAVTLNVLLSRYRAGWDEVVVRPARLARFCGPFGSDFPAEREAAYDHCVRLLLRSGLTWSSALRLPAAADAARSGRTANAPKSRPGPTTGLPTLHVPPSPEGDWQATLQGLIERRAWRSPENRKFLETLAALLARGHQIDLREARAVRNLWWSAETGSPSNSLGLEGGSGSAQVPPDGIHGTETSE